MSEEELQCIICHEKCGSYRNTCVSIVCTQFYVTVTLSTLMMDLHLSTSSTVACQITFQLIKVIKPGNCLTICDYVWENPGYGICVLLAQCIFSILGWKLPESIFFCCCLLLWPYSADLIPKVQARLHPASGFGLDCHGLQAAECGLGFGLQALDSI